MHFVLLEELVVEAGCRRIENGFVVDLERHVLAVDSGQEKNARPELRVLRVGKLIARRGECGDTRGMPVLVGEVKWCLSVEPHDEDTTGKLLLIESRLEDSLEAFGKEEAKYSVGPQITRI